MKRSTLIAAACLALAGGSACAASFDCARATSAMEKLVCSDAGLSKLDETLNAAYRSALGRTPDKEALRHAQRTWLSSYEVSGCRDAGCLRDAFSRRIEVLRALAGADRPGAAWTGHYVRYWKGREDKHAASITILGLENNRLHLAGTAVWLGPNADSGQVNTGEMTGHAAIRPDGSALFDDTDGCTALLHLRANTLAVEKESGCGGHNVTFDGEYRRRQ